MKAGRIRSTLASILGSRHTATYLLSAGSTAAHARQLPPQGHHLTDSSHSPVVGFVYVSGSGVKEEEANSFSGGLSFSLSAVHIVSQRMSVVRNNDTGNLILNR